MASIMLQKTVSELSGSTSKLEFDIYGEIGIPNSTVAVNFLQPVGAPNWTNVIFSIVHYPKYSSISPMYLSILRASFVSLVVGQSTLHLTESLFGDTSFFEVLKFPGGITVIPQQPAFLLQKPHASFNFTLNSPIYKVQCRMNELKDQMKTGLQDPYEKDLDACFLISLKQNAEESVPEYIQRFRDVRSRCYSLNLSDAQLAELAFQGLSNPIKERFFSQEFKSLAHLMQNISAHESQLQEAKEDESLES